MKSSIRTFLAIFIILGGVAIILIQFHEGKIQKEIQDIYSQMTKLCLSCMGLGG